MPVLFRVVLPLQHRAKVSVIPRLQRRFFKKYGVPGGRLRKAAINSTSLTKSGIGSLALRCARHDGLTRFSSSDGLQLADAGADNAGWNARLGAGVLTVLGGAPRALRNVCGGEASGLRHDMLKNDV